jgi:hypothetical protein
MDTLAKNIQVTKISDAKAARESRERQKLNERRESDVRISRLKVKSRKLRRQAENNESGGFGAKKSAVL